MAVHRVSVEMSGARESSDISGLKIDLATDVRLVRHWTIQDRKTTIRFP
jgi:hypothetical protein